jgi:5-methyltetrahydropteroyltriglutamate--homocysteine methyltransferase
MVGAILTGAFPRSDALVEATRAFDRKRLGRTELAEAYTADAKTVIDLQRAAGLQYTSDGQLNWQDLFRPLTEALSGIRLGPLTRWYDNNTFYRKPIVIDRPREVKPVAGEYYRTDLLPAGGKWRAALPGPYTFSSLSEDKTGGKTRDLILDLATVVSREAHRLEGQGFKLIQLNEPSLATDPPSKEIAHVVEAAIAEIFRGLNADTLVHTYFGHPGDSLEFLLDLPATFIGLDFYQVEVEALPPGEFDRGLVCGCVDARNSFLETPEEIASFAAKLRDRLDPPALLLAPNADLEFLPRTVAEQKLANLGKAVGLLEAKA